MAKRSTHHRRPQHRTADASNKSELALILHNAAERVKGRAVVMLRADGQGGRICLHSSLDQE